MPTREELEFAATRRRAFLRRQLSVEVNSYLDDLEEADQTVDRATERALESSLAAHARR